MQLAGASEFRKRRRRRSQASRMFRQLQGDLVGAKQGFERSLAIWQKNGDQYFSAYAMWSLGSLLLQEADFTGSRKMYEQALALRTSAGEKLTIAETQLALADLSLEEARSPAEQEVVVRQALEIFQTQKVRDDETEAWCSTRPRAARAG